MNLRAMLLGAVAVVCVGSTTSADPPSWDRSGLWRLESGAHFFNGCFDPCLCPATFEDDVQGSFALSLITVGDVFDFYDVNAMRLETVHLHWVYAGSGLFRFSQIVLQETMSVALAPSGSTAQQFNGQATVPYNPDTMDMEINVNNRVCFDTVFRIVASRCRADWDRDGAILPADVASFINTWVRSLTLNTLDGDYDGDGHVRPADVAAMVNAWFSGLSGGACS